jgi:thiol-disulfide isomerase/thioredoxin
MEFSRAAIFTATPLFKIRLSFFSIFLSSILHPNAQTISGHLPLLSNQEIILEGFDGFKTYYISSDTLDGHGFFKLKYTKLDYGVGYLRSADNKPMFLILSGENIEIAGEALSYTHSLKIVQGLQNQYFEQYAKEHPKREQALNAWIYLEKMYSSDPLFSVHAQPKSHIFQEKQRIKAEDARFLRGLPKESYVSWYLITRKLVSSVSVIAQYRAEEIPMALVDFRKLDYSDPRLYKSGLLKDAIESHFWLIENSGRSLDSVFIEMQISIDVMLQHLSKDEKKLNEITNHLFDLLERHSLFQASEYLALKVLNEVGCTLDQNLAKQLETYRAMKKGTTAPDILFEHPIYANGIKQTELAQLSDLRSPFTLVLFGAGWCPKCTELLPEVISNYAEWKKYGLEVLYISLDTNEATFQPIIHQYPFFSYCDFKKWESPIVRDYYVFGTPTMFLLDSNRQILLRPTSVKQVDAWVDWFLVQGKH